MAQEVKEQNLSKGCIPCRLVGGIGCLGASMYVVSKVSKSPEPIGRVMGFLFAGAIGGLGVMRLLDMSPFLPKETNISSTENIT